MRRVLLAGLMILYCVGIFVALDLAYSNLLHDRLFPRQTARVENAWFHHGLAANFDGSELWGSVRYRLVTNSLGFKDGAVRDVPLTPATRRVLLIGDSFTEAIGMNFENSFVGLLYQAGQERPEKIEFLNAAAVSYSPTVYYRKTKYLLEQGLRFDEMVVFVDISDVYDEATAYFCFDDDPRYRAYCPQAEGAPAPRAASVLTRAFRQVLKTNFRITDVVQSKFKDKLDQLRGKDLAYWIPRRSASGWTILRYDLRDLFYPLDLDTAIARSVQNMQALADLLAARRIPLTIVVYPWPTQLMNDDRDSRQVSIWREFCVKNCKAFIDLFPVFFAEKDADKEWYARLFLSGDVHLSGEGNRLVFRELKKRLL